jgi:hypothetical protein
VNTRQRRTAHLDAWRRSLEFREIAQRQCQKMNAAHLAAPRCGATRRDGEACRNPVVKGRTRCRFHGGATPKGRDWHRPKWPSDGPLAIEKMTKKLRDRERVGRKRAKRLAAMPPDELAAYRQWERAHQPGPPGPRARARAERDGARAMQRALNDPDEPRPVSPERAELQARAAELRRMLAEAEARVAAGAEPRESCFD